MGISATGSGGGGGGASSGASSSGGGNKVSSGGASESSKAAAKAEPKTEVVAANPTTGTVKDKVDVNKPDETPNPYSSFAPYAEQVTAEKWTKDRTPGEGQVKKDDHLIGMLENRGFSAKEIYAKDADGKTMLDRVAAANNLDNPNLIQAGQSYILPSRNEPAETNAEASAHAQGLENAYADASADQKLGNLENQKASANSKAEASAQQGDATAKAKTDQTVGDMKNSVAKAGADAKATSVNGDAKADAASTQKAGNLEDSRVANTADAKAASVTGDAEAKAKADQTVGTMKDSVATNAADAKATSVNGDVKADATATQKTGAIEASSVTNTADAKASTVTGDAAAQAKAEQTVTSAVDSTVTNAANAKAETLTGEATTVADAKTTVGAVENSTVQNSATVEQTQGPQTQTVTADTQVQAEKAGTVTLADTAVATPSGVGTQQTGTVENVVGPAVVDQTALGLDGKGTSQQKLEVEGPQVAVTQQSDAAKVDQSATNYADPATTPVDASTAVLNASNVEFASQTSTGFQNSDLKAEGGMAAMSSDAQQAKYSLEGERVTAYHTGSNGTLDASVKANEVYIKDGSTGMADDFTQSGNTVTGNVDAHKITLDAHRSNSVQATLGTSAGDSTLDLKLPTGPYGGQPAGDNIHVPLADGNDFLNTTGGNPVLTVDKPSGQLHANQSDLKGDGVNLQYNLGKSDFIPQVDLSGTQGAQVGIQSAGGDLNGTFNGGPGSTMKIELTGDQPIPRVVTDPGSWVPIFGRPETASAPAGDGGTLNVNGFENVTIMRGDQTVWSSDPNWKP